MNELAGIDAEASRDLEQVMEAQVAPAPIDLAQERPVDAGLMGQGFLAEAQASRRARTRLPSVAVAGESGSGIAQPTTYASSPYV